MIRKHPKLGAVAVLAVAAASLAATDPQTIWSGVYTAAQARRGERTAAQFCVACHSSTEWSRPEFLRAWNSKTVEDLFEKIKETMPKSDPGSLEPQEYADVIAYMLKINGAPAGETELSTDEEALEAVKIVTPRP